jgi:hypothetical protein
MQSPAQIILSETVKLAVGCAKALALMKRTKIRLKSFIVG